MNGKKLKYIAFLFLLSVFPITVCAQENSAKTVTDSTSIEGKNTENDSLMYSHPAYNYNTYGKKDPFESQVPVEDEENVIKELFSYEQATILGIVNSDTQSYALVADRNGASYVLRVGDRVFGGYVEQITENALVLDIVKYARAMTIIMRLESSKYTVFEEIEGVSSIRRPGINITYGKGQAESSDITIEDVTVPSIDTKFIEEEWFGPKEEIIPLNEEEPVNNQSNLQGIIPLLEPSNQTWITLPYVFEWLNPEKLECVFTLVIYDDSELNNPVFIENDINTSTYLLGDNVDLPVNRDLYWEVIAHEPSGKERLNKQTVLSFKIKGQ
ncbi:hypothetical protein ACFL50_05750 [Candidatus Latescibacterota bacterium]